MIGTPRKQRFAEGILSLNGGRFFNPSVSPPLSIIQEFSFNEGPWLKEVETRDLPSRRKIQEGEDTL